MGVKRPSQVEVQLETAAATLAATRVVAGNASFVAPRNTPALRITMSYEEIRRAPGAIGDVSRLVQAMPGVLTGNARATTSSPVAAARWRICSSWTDSKCRT